MILKLIQQPNIQQFQNFRVFFPFNQMQSTHPPRVQWALNVKMWFKKNSTTLNSTEPITITQFQPYWPNDNKGECAPADLFLFPPLLLPANRGRPATTALHHHSNFSLHHHFILDGAGHRQEGKRHLDLADRSRSYDFLVDKNGCGEANVLTQEHVTAPVHPGADHCWDQSVNQDTVHYGLLEGGGPGIHRVQVKGIGVTRQLGKKLHITGRKGLGEGGLLAHMEKPTGRRCRGPGRQA